MHRLMVFGLLSVLFLGTCMSLSANTLEGNSIGILSSSTPSNFIDHLPFTINTTGVYYIVKDLTVNGDGIKVLANDTVLLGQGHIIVGDGTGTAVNISASNTIVSACNIHNFTNGICLQPGSSSNRIWCNKIYDNYRGVYFKNRWPFKQRGNSLCRNVIVDNSFGLFLPYANGSKIWNNYFRNKIWNSFDDSNETNTYNMPITLETNIIGGSCTGGNYWHNYAGNDTNGDGLGDYPYVVYRVDYSDNRDYHPLVDIISPQYGLRAFNSSSPSVSLSTTWKDNVQLDKVILQLDGVNYTNSARVSESLGFNEYYQVEHKVTYSSFFVLPTGPHTYRWYANDTSNHWNSTQVQSFNVVQTNINSVDISSTLKVSANITCQGASNITEEMDTVDMEFNIDGTWYSRGMTYSPSTKLYSALVPEYNQLANKTILIYVVAKTKQNQFLNSDIYIYNVPQWVAADLNRDGKVTILDIVKATSQYGQPYP